MLGIRKGQAPQSRLVWLFDFTALCLNYCTHAAKKQGKADAFGSNIYAVLCKGLGKGSRNSICHLDGN
jgi:hypothetical protein